MSTSEIGTGRRTDLVGSMVPNKKNHKTNVSTDVQLTKRGEVHGTFGAPKITTKTSYTPKSYYI